MMKATEKLLDFWEEADVHLPYKFEPFMLDWRAGILWVSRLTPVSSAERSNLRNDARAVARVAEVS